MVPGVPLAELQPHLPEVPEGAAQPAAREPGLAQRAPVAAHLVPQGPRLLPAHAHRAGEAGEAQEPQEDQEQLGLPLLLKEQEGRLQEGLKQHQNGLMGLCRLGSTRY